MPHSGYGDALNRVLRVTLCAAAIIAQFAFLRSAQALAAAPAAPVPAANHDQRAVLVLNLNGVPKGEVFTVIRGPDVLVEVEALEKAGLKEFTGSRETIRGRVFVSLASLAPQLTYQIDLKKLELEISAQPAHLPSNVVSLSTRQRPSGLVVAENASFFANYQVSIPNWQWQQPSISGETGLSLFGNTLLDNIMSRSSTGQVIREATNVTIDSRSRMTELGLGDGVVVPLDPLGGAGSFGGISLSRDFALDPYFISFPQPALSGVAMLPSTADIYINGIKVRSEQIPPGAFSLQGLPLTAGAGSTQVVIRDAFGRQQQLAAPYYLATQLLERGLSQYSLYLGPLREELGTSSWQYGKFIFQGNYRYGVNDWFTPGVRLEGAGDVLSGGPSAAVGTLLGTFSLAAGLSEGTLKTTSTKEVSIKEFVVKTVSENTTGYAASVSYSYLAKTFGLGGFFQVLSGHYSNIGLSPATGRALYQAAISGSVPLGPALSVTPELGYEQPRDGGSSNTASVTANFRVTASLSLFFSVMRSQSPHLQPQYGFSVGLGFPLGDNRVVSSSYDYSSGGSPQTRGNAEALQLERGIPAGPGYGYTLTARTGQGQDTYDADLQYRGDHGFYEFEGDKQSGRTSTLLNLSGSIVALDGRVLMGPPIQNAFALVHTGGVPNVEGYVANQPYGRSDARGDLLLPFLASYVANEISVNDRDLPVNYKIDATKMYISPPNRGGAVVPFPIRPIRAITGRIEVEVKGQTVPPSYGDLRVVAEGKTFTSPLNKKGAFYLDSPPPGKYSADVGFEQGICKFSIKIPKGKESTVSLGTLRCVMP